MDTNRHEDRWTSFNDKRNQNASALLSRWCDHVIGGSPPGSAGVPPAQILPQLQPSPPPESTGNGALPLLRPGRCGSRPQGGCLQHRTEAQPRPKGQDAGGTPALPGDAVPAVPWGVSGGRLLRKPTCTLWETPVCPPAVPLSPDREDHTRVKQRVLMPIRSRGHVPLNRFSTY